MVRDHWGKHARGKDNILEFAATPNVVAFFGGFHTPVALQELNAIHTNKLVYLGPWAAGTPVVDNGYEPNTSFAYPCATRLRVGSWSITRSRWDIGNWASFSRERRFVRE